jgi:hypothetical protein
MKNKYILLILFSLMLLINISCSQNEKISNNIDDWFKAGSRPDLYEIGKDAKNKYDDEPSLYLKSIQVVDSGFGTIMRNIEPGEYKKKRIMLTGFIKSENISSWAGMWMRVDGPDPKKSLQFDNMQSRPIKGTTDWTEYEIVLDVPENSTQIAYGVLVNESGHVWFSKLSTKVVGEDVQSTNMLKIENPVDGWFKAGSKPYLYEIGKDENIKHNEQPSYYLKSISEVTDGFGTIMNQSKPDEYLGKRVKMSGFIKAENIVGWAGMWMRVDGPDPEKSLQFDNMHNRPLKGTKDWTKYEIVLDVPENSTGIAYGVLINGSGQVWLGSFSFEVVGDDVPSTNMEKR